MTLSEHIGDSLSLILENTSTTTAGALNNSCGADYVKTSQKLPPSLASKLKPGQRGCSLDGDADRLMYFYLDDTGKFHMLDGDKIAALTAAFIVELVKNAGLEGQINLGVVQTAYANGASTKYLSEVSLNTTFKRTEKLMMIDSAFLSNVFQPESSISTMPQNTTISGCTSRPMDMEQFYSLQPAKKSLKPTNHPHLPNPQLSTI